MILVTGATGTVGSEVVRLLAAGGEQVRAMARDVARVPALPGVETAQGDFGDPESLTRAVKGTEAIFLLTAPGPQVVEHDAAMLAATRAANVRKVVKLSAIGTDDQVGSWHHPGEQALRDSGPDWTILRPTSFDSNTLRWLPFILRGEPIQNTRGKGAEGWVDPRDLAAVAARALTSDACSNRVLTLTGPELLNVQDVVTILGEVLGQALTTVGVPLEVYREQLIAAGVAPAFADVAVHGSRLVAEGGNAVVTDDVAEVLGRAPRTFATWATDHRTAFIPS